MCVCLLCKFAVLHFLYAITLCALGSSSDYLTSFLSEHSSHARRCIATVWYSRWHRVIICINKDCCFFCYNSRVKLRAAERTTGKFRGFIFAEALKVLSPAGLPSTQSKSKRQVAHCEGATLDMPVKGAKEMRENYRGRELWAAVWPLLRLPSRTEVNELTQD